MKTGLAVLSLVLLLSSVVPAGVRGLPPPEDRAAAQFNQAAKDAEAAYRETILGSYRVLDGALLDEERAAVKRWDIEEANRVRRCRDLSSWLAAEIAQHDYLGGIVRAAQRSLATDSSTLVLSTHARELGEAAKTYSKALRTGKQEVKPLLMIARDIAIRSGDLDAANRVMAAEEGIDKEIAERMSILFYREYRFTDMHELERNFLVGHPEAWRVTDGELICMLRTGDRIEVTPRIDFESISAVTIHGRIRPSFRTNFRLHVGPVHAIFNWERAAECHFRYFQKLTVHRGNLLVPGKEHEISVRQLTRKSVELTVDGKRAWISHGKLDGTITINPSQSSIGVREIRVLGVLKSQSGPGGPTHRRR